MKVITHFLTAGRPKLTKHKTLLKQVVQIALGRILPFLNYANEVDIVFSVKLQVTLILS